MERVRKLGGTVRALDGIKLGQVGIVELDLAADAAFGSLQRDAVTIVDVT